MADDHKALSPSSPEAILAGMRAFGIAPDRSDLRDLEYAVAVLRAEVERLTRERDEAREALKPFAKEAELWAGYDETENLVEQWANGPPSSIKVLHLRRARAVLGGRDV